ncbi:serine/threonine-protein kinase [Nocardia mexicana]|uniref:Serine/threonine protein kinase n=1 Tax=Nocardia mexicana TaxID=279262 RepID=A0A370HDW7_9NOCA|nr:serine/threonine-protein kinase [Nocardia mexicana]RDI55433.1 serine/threonine protein kinase [Nocardia mexicana]
MRPLGSDDPTTIGPYRILGILGSGGMGRVYLGRTAGGRTVAVKVVRPDLAGNPEFRTRFRREVTAARRVAGPYTVPVLDADVDSYRPWLATGFVSGLSLTDAVDGYGPLPEASLLTLATGLAHALTDIHATGLIHRDLKPSNVLLAVDGPRVIDFGIARAVEDTALTTTGQLIGSPGYMCPEQITGDAPVGPPGDVFALGGILVFAATGNAPFGNGDSIPMLWRVVQQEPRLDGVPDSLRPLIAACLAKTPESRPTPAQLVQQLAPFGHPDTRGWLPGPILEDISRRAIALLDLEATALPTDATPPPQPETGHAAATRPPTTVTSSPSYNPAGQAHPPPHPGTTILRDAPVQPMPPHRTKRATLIVAAIATMLVAATIGGIVAYNTASGRGGDSAAADPSSGAETSRTKTSGAKPSRSESSGAGATSGAASSATMPRDYVGTWKGTATDGIATFDIVVTLKAGKVGEEVGSATNTGNTSHMTCKRAETLTAVDSSGITLRARLTRGDTTPGIGCDDDGKTSTLKRHDDGTATYSMNGRFGDISGTVRRQ